MFFKKYLVAQKPNAVKNQIVTSLNNITSDVDTAVSTPSPFKISTKLTSVTPTPAGTIVNTPNNKEPYIENVEKIMSKFKLKPIKIKYIIIASVIQTKKERPSVFVIILDDVSSPNT